MTTTSPLPEGSMVELYIDKPSIGSGFRHFLVMEIKRKVVRLLYPPAIRAVSVDRKHFDAKARAAPCNPKMVRGIILDHIALLERHSPGKRLTDIRYAKAALKLLRAK